MDIQVNGRITKNKERAVTFIQTAKNTTVNGQETRNQETAHTSIRMVMSTLEDGRMIEDLGKEK